KKRGDRTHGLPSEMRFEFISESIDSDHSLGGFVLAGTEFVGEHACLWQLRLAEAKFVEALAERCRVRVNYPTGRIRNGQRCFTGVGQVAATLSASLDGVRHVLVQFEAVRAHYQSVEAELDVEQFLGSTVAFGRRISRAQAEPLAEFAVALGAEYQGMQLSAF